MGALGVMSPRLWSKPICFPKIWWSCEVLGGVKSSFILEGFWAWYVLILSCCFSLLLFLFDVILIPSFCFKAVQNTFRLKEMTNSLYQQLDDKRKRKVAAVQTLAVAENSNANLKKKLTIEEQARKSTDST